MATSGFVRRVNRDLTIDSICLSCFKPVARAVNDVDLVDEENLHTCESLESESALHRLSARNALAQKRLPSDK